MTLIVNTKHSRYEFDSSVNPHTYTRYRVHPNAADLEYADVRHGEPNVYDEALLTCVGESMTIVHPDGSWVRSTPVTSIEYKADDQPVLPYSYEKEAKAA